MSAVLAWLCLVDDPIPADLGTLFDTAVTDDLAALLASVPWLRDVEDGIGLLWSLTQMRNPDDFPWFTRTWD
ncbi:hypothetical protein [Streptomyces tropicalis]|uniref:Transposase n=1 Tax=Streptomyces tropicalis TaxID=3034234 RepID=A0ABT6A2Q8_9ACTN|nr:hypothetical protein [Streptomyces tropicalis]MDF3298747.1 hypothetical protein [Streptomyces tropicalis]